MHIANFSKIGRHYAVLLFYFIGCLWQQKAVAQLSISTAQVGTNTNVAPQYIDLLPAASSGYQTTPTGSNYMVAYIDNPPAAEALYSNNLFTPANFIKTINTTLPVGATDGSAGTTPNGGSTYNLPIAIPVGTNGITPNVNIAYNSQAGNGPLGVGWNIGGLSVITRVGRDIYHDGEVAAIGSTLGDFFALDGQRLISTSGTYGANSSTYATEVESFSRITAYSTSGNNPEWFKVETKDGMTLEYGYTADAKLLNDALYNSAAIGSVVLLWRLNKMYDTYGNYIEFKYTNTDRDSRIEEISYTGNSAANMLPYNKVKFEWETRNDQNTTYTAGQSFSTKYLLRKIRIFAEADNFMKEYRFNYSKDNLFSYLREVVELGNDYSLLNSTIFKYGDAAVFFSSEALNGTSAIGGLNRDKFAGDFDGDGYADLVYSDFVIDDNDLRHNFATTIYRKIPSTDDYDNTFSQAASFYPSVNNVFINDDVYSQVNSSFSDFNADGRTDLLYAEVPYPNILGTPFLNRLQIDCSVSSNNGTISFAPTYTVTPLSTYNCVLTGSSYIHQGDFNGDGQTDVITLLMSGNYQGNYCIDCYKAFVSFPSLGANNIEIVDPIDAQFAFKLLASGSLHIADVDGDGKDELLFGGNANFSTRVYKLNPNLSNANQWIATEITTYSGDYISAHKRVYFGDFNGDGLTDCLTQGSNSPSSSLWKIGYSTGSSFTIQAMSFTDHVPNLLPDNVPDPDNLFEDKIVVADFNGDGLSDILVGYNLDNTNARFNVYYSKGNLNLTGDAINNFDWLILNNDAISATEPLVAADYNGDGRIDISYCPKNNLLKTKMIFVSIEGIGNKERLLQKVTNGFNTTTEFVYNKLSKPGVHTQTAISNTDYPINNVQPPFYVVTQTKQPDGIGGISTTNYTYEGAKLHRTGKGFLGFTKVNAYNDVNNMSSITELALNTTFATLLPFKQTSKLGNVISNAAATTTLSQTTNTLQLLDLGNKRYSPRVIEVSENQYFEGTQIGNTLTQNVYLTNNTHGYGNIASSTTTIRSIFGASNNTLETIVTSYPAYVGGAGTPTGVWSYGSWCPAKPTSTTITTTRLAESAVSRTTTRTFDTAKGVLLTQTDLGVTTTNTYNNTLGNLIGSTISASGLTSRSKTVAYDPKGRFVVQTTNALNQTSYAYYDSRWAKPTRTVSIDGLNTYFEYDAFGRLKKTSLPDGNIITNSYVWDVQNGTGTDLTTINNAVYFTLTTNTNAPDQKTWYDRFNRERKIQTENFSSNNVTAAYTTAIKTYDAKGNPKTSTSPFNTTNEAVISTNTYDSYNRLSKTITSYTATPTTANTQTDYAYLLVSSGLPTNINSAVKVQATQIQSNTQVGGSLITYKIGDITGKEIRAYDGLMTLDYTYDSRANRKEVKNGTTTLATITYDANGRQDLLIDIDAGTTNYDYNAYGELTKETNANGSIHDMLYDLGGRLVNRYVSGTNAASEGAATYTYISSGNGKGQLQTVSVFNGPTQAYTYDALGRVIQSTETIDATPYTTNYGYDNAGNNTSVDYLASGFGIRRTFNTNGFLTKITDATGATAIFDATAATASVNALNQYTNYKLSNGAISVANQYNKYGMPTLYSAGTGGSTTNVQNYLTAFDIQTGNLTYRQDLLAGTTAKESFSYDANSRLLNNTANGTTPAASFAISYSTNGNINSKTDIGNYTYSASKIHAVTGVANTNQPISLFQQDVTYSAFLQPTFITEPSATNQANVYGLTLQYGSDYQRIKGLLTLNGTTQNTRYYLGSYEKNVSGGGNTEWVHYVSGADGLAAIVTITNSAAPAYHYVFKDHLGSILRVTNAAGTPEADQSFDAWGRRRNPTNWTYTGVTPPTQTWLYRGYTAHEHLDQFALINMNGRLYDPTIGRMLSTDNYVQDALYGQTFNRYTYANNNPLKYTDPDGENPILIGMVIGAVAHTIIHLATHNFTFEDWDWGSFAGSVVAGGVGGAVGPALVAANIGGVAGGAITGAISGFAGSFVTSLWHKQPAGTVVTNSFKGAAWGALIGGTVGGIDAALKRLPLWKGNPKMPPVVKPSPGGTAKPGIVEPQPLEGEMPAWANPVTGEPIPAKPAGASGLESTSMERVTGNNVYKHQFKYADRVRMRGVQDPVSHNFPYSFDDAILSTTAIEKSGGYKIFQLQGAMNGKPGVYEIGLQPSGIIDHRFFRPFK